MTQQEEADVAELVQLRGQVSELAVQLEVAPFAERTVALMRRHVEQDAERARRIFSRWAALPAAVRDQVAAELREAAQ